MKHFSDIPEEEPFLPVSQHTAPKSDQQRRSIWQIAVLTVSITLNLFALYRLSSSSLFPNLNRICASNVEQYPSPLLDDVNVRYDTVRFNGSFLKETIYRRRPSPEVDAAWDDLGANLEGFIVSEEDGVRFGLDPGMVKRLSRQGGGYVVMSEGMHHLHCVNLLRQSSYFNYEYYRKLGKGPFKNEDDVVETHIGHCVDILRQQLMCTFDTSIFGQWWVEDVGPFVDFNTKHRCKNFDALSGWVRDHQLSKSAGDLVEFREGDVRLKEIP